MSVSAETPHCRGRDVVISHRSARLPGLGLAQSWKKVNQPYLWINVPEVVEVFKEIYLVPVWLFK